jgi:hypothetical protein
MAKVGRFVTDPRAGAYCQIAFENGEKIIINHDKGGFKGGSLTIDEVKWWGLGSGAALFRCELDSAEGKAAISRLTQGAAEGSATATPLGALVNYIRDCESIAEVKARCESLLARAA